MLDEKLSALMDDELESAEVEACLQRLNQDDSARQAWSRQHLLRAVLNDQAASVSADFSKQVMAAIEAEGGQGPVPAYKSKVIPFRRPQWLSGQWAGGLALAASIVAVILLAPLAFDDTATSDKGGNFAENNAAETQRVALGQRRQANEEARRELQQYLLNHEALVSGHGLSGQRGYMRMASPSTTYVAYSPE